MLKIFCPHTIETKTGARLQAVFEVDGIQKVLWYEVEKKYAQYLTEERADAFIVGLLWYALKHRHDIQVLSPMSERLYYTMNNYLTPLMASILGLRKIRILCEEPTSEPLPHAGAVGTGLSCGIDSLCTVYEHMGDDVPDNYKITHFTFFNVGSHRSFDGEEANKLFEERAKVIQTCADELGKDLIKVNSNLTELLKMWFGPTCTHRNMSAVLALQKLFRVYLYSSGIDIRNFKITKQDPGYYDIFNMSMLSTENTDLFSTLTNYTRVERTRMVSEFKPSYKYLNVCFNSTSNCGGCPKCLRTLLTLEILGQLDKYKSLFNMDVYFKKRSEYIATVLAERNKKTFFKDIYNEMLRTNFLKK